MTNFLIAILAFFLLIGIIIIIHEGGHYVTALLCRIKILEFSLGFGPKIIERKIGKDQTLFTLRAIPMGGFVKPLDRHNMSKEDWEKVSSEDKARAFSEVKKWRKFLMVAGGPLSNFILAFIIFTGVYIHYGTDGVKPVIASIEQNSLFSDTPIKVGDEIVAINGEKTPLNHIVMSNLLQTAMSKNSFEMTIKNNDGLKTYTIPVKNLNYDGLSFSQESFHGLKLEKMQGDILINYIKENSPAYLAGIKLNDIIKKVNGETVNSVDNVIATFHKNPGKEFNLTYFRDGQEHNVKVTPVLTNYEGQEVGLIGIRAKVINPTNNIHLQFNLIEASKEAFYNTVRQFNTNMTVIWRLITGDLSTKTISGPLSIAEYSGTSFQLGAKYFLQMMAIISIAIGFFNLLPVPMLDGGHLAQYIIETIRRKDFTVEQLMFVQKIGIACLVGIFTLAISNDIIRYVTTYF